MNLDALLALLEANPTAALAWTLPDGRLVPAHFHVTEVGRVQKEFIDCGGVVRSTTSCTLQLWTANDFDHRVDAAKLLRILRLAAPILKSVDLPVEVEYEYEDVGVLRRRLASAEAGPTGIVLRLSAEHTACLAPDRCGVLPIVGADCGPTGCC